MSNGYDFKKEEDVKEFLQNLGTEYRYGCYEEKNPEICDSLGDYLESIKKELPKAAIVFKDNCDQNKYGKSCTKYAKYLVGGKGECQKNLKEAFNYYMKGCNFGSGEACFGVGILLTSGANGEKLDYKRGVEYFEKGCKENDAKSCYFASSIYLKNKEVSQNLPKAFEYAVKACELGEMHACANVSMMYKNGDGVEKNVEQSIKYKKIVQVFQEELKKKVTPIKFSQ